MIWSWLRSIRWISGTSVKRGLTRSMATPMQGGRTPKATRSDRESIWMPKLIARSVRSFFVRATLPSKVSHRPLSMRKNMPMKGWPMPFRQTMMPMTPDSSDM